MIVVDASVAVNGLLRDGPSRGALSADSLHAPFLLDTEIVSAVRRLAAAKQLSGAQAEKALEAWLAVPVVRYSAGLLMPRVWELRNNLTAYDATYVALAEALQCPLVTADTGLANAAGIRCAVTVLPD